MGPQAAAPQIHQHERHVIQDVDARDVVVELDAVENSGRAIEQADIPQVQIAVALTDETRTASRIQARGVTTELGSRLHGKARAERRIQDVRIALEEFARVPVRHPRHARTPPVIGPDSRAGMQMRDRRCQRGHRRDVEATALGEPIEQGFLIESLHLDQPVDRVAMAVERKGSVGLTGHRAHRDIQRRRRTSIQPHFRLARGVPQRGG